MSRKREADKKRSDREREEISAFFLKGNIPIISDTTRAGSKPAGALLSSADGATGDTSSRVSGRGRSPSQSAVAVQCGLRPSMAQEREWNEHVQGSKATTYLSWTTSRGSPRPRARLASQSTGEQNSIRSPTPPDVREALVETGVFHNTGIRYMGPTVEDRETWSRDEVTMSRQPGRSPRILASRTHQNEPIRIVRYQDRGTMVTQEDAPQKFPDEHIRDTHVRPPAVTSEERLQEAPKTPPAAPLQTDPALASRIPSQLMRRTGDAHVSPGSNQATGNPIAINGHGDEQDIRPERPVSPKLSVVERLEAAANSHRRERSERETTQNARHSEWYLGYPGGGLESIPLSHEGAYWWPACTARLGMVRDREIPVTAASCFVSSESAGPLVRNTSVHEMTSEAAGHVRYYEPPGYWAVDVPPSVMFDQNARQVGQRGQGMREYITQLEREILDKPHEDVVWEPTPCLDLDIVEERDDRAPTGHQPQTRSGIRPPSRMNSTSLRQSPGGAPRLGWVQSWNFEDTEEQERKFMSSFWRPNRY